MYWKYFKYVVRHKWFVFQECRKHGIIWRGIMHDMSKFRPSEFIPYARYFYGDYQPYDDRTCGEFRFYKEDIKRHFDKAWLLHIHRNPHHWQHWILQGDDGPVKLIPPPIKYLREMGCDWVGAGRAITGKDNIKEWYAANKDKMQLGRIQKKWLERHFVGEIKDDI